MANLAEEIQALVEQLSPAEQLQVLEYARMIAQMQRDGRPLPRSTPPPGTPSSALPRFHLSEEDAEAMERAIMEDCEWTPDFR